MTRANSVKVDYLVATVPLSSVEEETLDRLAGLVIEGEYRKVYGYRGFVKNSIYVGDNGNRMMIQATGSAANEAVDLVNAEWQQLSVARLDIQLTVLVADADSVIRSTMPPMAYKAVRMINLGERGSTLYVGSPKSRCRLRIYNKTAEAGEDRIDGNERLRIELQLRDDYADRALINIEAGTADMFFRHYVSRMSDGYITSIVDRALANSNMLSMTDRVTEKSTEGRREWIEHCVLPALIKLSVQDKEYYGQLVNRLKELLD